MDGHRFDTLVKNLAAPRSRRHLLQRLVAPAAAALALRLSTVTGAGQVVSTDETCSQDSDCLPAEADPCTGAFCDAGSCTYTNVACIPGYVCCGNGACCPEGEEGTSPDATNIDATGSGESDGAGHPEATTSDPLCAAAHSSE